MTAKDKGRSVRRIKRWLLKIPGVAATYRILKKPPEVRITRHFEEARRLMERYELRDFTMTRKGAFFRSPWGAEFVYVPDWGAYGAEHGRLHEEGELELCRRQVPRNATVLDIGANLGTFSIHLATKRPDLQFVAFEPVQSTYEYLQTNLRRNGLSDRVSAFRLAVADRPGEVRMTNRAHTDNRMLDGAVLGTRSEVVPVTTLDAVVEEQSIANVRLIKADIEGAELLALRGARRLLRTQRPILLLEVIAEHLKSLGCSIDDLERFLAEEGYRRLSSDLLLPHNRLYAHGECRFGDEGSDVPLVQ